ncbi:MAG TPA: TonB-dependent receptor [Gemmatimonadales bacterium]|nr:TonB-dependent receptor [Gemmatimonadales bacterium]
MLKGFPTLLLAAGLAAGFLSPASAQTESTLRGTVVDAATGAPLPGARVSLVPGGRRAVTDSLGQYVLREVRAGRYRVEALAGGYVPDVRDSVALPAGQTVVLDFVLRPDAVPLQQIVVEGRPDPVLDPKVTATTRTITAQDLRQLPVTTLDEAVELQAGAVGGSYRGGRIGQELVIVDGLGVKNQLDASGGVLGVRIPSAALEEAALVTNGFSARYGQALSGMINVVTRDGPERLEGSLAWETDRPLGNGGDYGLDRVALTVGGPLGPLRLLAVVDGRARLDDDPTSAPRPSDPLDPRFDAPWILPHNSGEAIDLFAKATLPLGAHTLRLLGAASDQRRLLFDPELKYQPDRGPGQETTGRLGLFHYQFAPGPGGATATVLDLRVGYFEKQALRGPLTAMPDYRFGAFTLGGFEFAGEALARARDTAGASAAIPGFTAPLFSVRSPWSVPAFFLTDSRRGELAWNRYREGRVRLDAFLGRGPDTDLRFGAEYVGQRVETFVRLEAYRPVADGAPSPRASTFSPFSAAAYGEAVQRWNDLSFTLGLRADLFDARGAGTAVLGETKLAVSPRLGVSTALGRATVVASVGRFAQAPDFQYLVDAAFDDTLRTGRFRRGNPALGFETSTQYEMQARFRTTEATAVRLGGYVKRLDGLVASVPVGLDPDSAVFGNADYGTVRGIEASIERSGPHLQVRASYVLQSAEATASNALDFYRRLHIDPMGDTVIPATVAFPLDFDQRHQGVAMLLARAPERWTPWLRGFEVGAVGRWSSGLPYTRTNLTGDSLLGLPNSHRLPSQWMVDLRLGRTFTVGRMALELWVDARNLTGRRNVVAVRRDTGSPSPGEPQIEAMAQAAYADRPYAIPYESPAYRPEHDLDHNGRIEGEAELLPLFRRAAQDYLQPLFAYGAPRLMRLGVRIGF